MWSLTMILLSFLASTAWSGTLLTAIDFRLFGRLVEIIGHRGCRSLGSLISPYHSVQDPDEWGAIGLCLGLTFDQLELVRHKKLLQSAHVACRTLIVVQLKYIQKVFGDCLRQGRTTSQSLQSQLISHHPVTERTHSKLRLANGQLDGFDKLMIQQQWRLVS